MNHREAVDQNSNIIAVSVESSEFCADLILIDDLQGISVNVVFVDEGDISGHAVIQFEGVYIVFL